jgi:phenylacetate-CoA ligase
VRGIIAESEIVYPEQRRLIEDTFGCRLFSCYGHTEKLVAAAACERSANYHVWPTYGFFELLDDRGQLVATRGQRGEIVGTGFINDVVPFIRYRTGDRATYEGEGCLECGRAHTIIREIRGHNIQEVLVTRDGTRITWTALNVHDDTFDHVLQFQFYQDEPGRAVLRVVPAAGFSGKDRRRIERTLGLKFDGRLDFMIEVVDSVSLSSRGKAIYVDQRIPDLDAADSASPGTG